MLKIRLCRVSFTFKHTENRVTGGQHTGGQYLINKGIEPRTVSIPVIIIVSRHNNSCRL